MTPSSSKLTLIYYRQSLFLDVRKTSAGNVTKATTIQRQRTTLLKRIQNYISSRAQYMPGLERYLCETPNRSGDMSTSTPELIPLHLPSSIPSENRASVFVPGLAEIEDRLRFAQACEALTDLRCQLTKRSYASRYRTANISSQIHFTRFRELQQQTDSKIKSACSRYQIARSGLLNLRGNGNWERELQVLHPEDIRGLSEKALVNEEKEERKKTQVMAGLSTVAFEDNQDLELPPTLFNPHLAVGEGHRTLSWIWYSTSNDEIISNKTTRIGSCKFFFWSIYTSARLLGFKLTNLIQSDLRVEWLKCRARANRWKEEIQLVEEEMRRSLEFCRWLGQSWLERATSRTGMTSHLQEGLLAFAAEMSDMEKHRQISWEGTWASIRERAKMVLERHLNDKDGEEGIEIPKMTVEIDFEDGQEIFDEFSDTE